MMFDDTTPCPVPNAHHNTEAVLTPGCLPTSCPVPYVHHNKENILTVLAPQRLPTPCPVPCMCFQFVPYTRAIAKKQLIGNKKLTLLSEACYLGKRTGIRDSNSSDSVDCVTYERSNQRLIYRVFMQTSK